MAIMTEERFAEIGQAIQAAPKLLSESLGDPDIAAATEVMGIITELHTYATELRKELAQIRYDEANSN